MERWKNCDHPNHHKHAACDDGEWVRYDEAKAEIAILQAEVERLRSELAEALEGWHVEMPNSIAIHNAAIEKAAYLFTHPDEEGIADRIWELRE